MSERVRRSREPNRLSPNGNAEITDSQNLAALPLEKALVVLRVTRTPARKWCETPAPAEAGGRDEPAERRSPVIGQAVHPAGAASLPGPRTAVRDADGGQPGPAHCGPRPGRVGKDGPGFRMGTGR